MLEEMIIYSGDVLKNHVEATLRGIQRERDIAKELHDYVTSPNDRKVCCLYGLRRTGKTIMMLQEIQKVNDYSKCLLIECGDGNTVMQLRNVIEENPEAQYIFIDEITKARNFIGAGSVFADRYAAEGKKVILTGTDSLGFFLARSDELYDRAHLLHTTYISFKEYHTLLGKGIMDYIRYGGTLSPENVFYNRDTTNQYSNSAIVENIVHSLEKWNQGRNYGILRDIVDNGDLPSFISKVIEYDSREFLAKIINRQFVSHDLGSLIDLISKSNISTSEIIYPSDNSEESIAARKDMQERIRIFLHIKSNMLEANPESVQTIIDYLVALDVLYKLPQSNGKEEYLFTQTGMRYSQASDLAQALTSSDAFNRYSDVERTEILKKIQEDICGGILEDTVLYQTSRVLNASERRDACCVSKFRQETTGKEFDMYVADYERKSACVFEVKLSNKYTSHQTRHLVDKEFCNAFEAKTGAAIINRVLLYNGKTMFNPGNVPDDIGKVLCLNVEDFLLHSEMLIKLLNTEKITEKKQFCKAMQKAGVKLPNQDAGLGNTD